MRVGDAGLAVMPNEKAFIAALFPKLPANMFCMLLLVPNPTI